MSEEKLNVKAFNQGYLIKKHMNKEYSSIAKAVENNPDYGTSFIEGGNTATQEIQQDKLKDIANIRARSNEQDRNLER